MIDRESDVVMSPETARRVASAVKKVERMLVNSPRGMSRQLAVTPAMAFKVTTAIGAATTQLAPGQGKGTLLNFNDTTGLFTLSTQTNILIWSLSEIGITVGSTVQCVSMYGQWFYDVTMCSNGAS
jgi:hypothetical protein